MDHARVIRVLIAEDHPVMRDGLASTIRVQDDMQLVATASTGTEAVELHRRHRPDVTILDLRLPDMTGAQVIVAIRKEHRAARLIVLTAYDGDEVSCQAVRAGARGYLNKIAHGHEIAETVRAVHRGERRIPAHIDDRVLEQLSHGDLTPREVAVLIRVGRGMGNKEIAAELGISAGTVKNHLTSVIEKLGARDRGHAVVLALERGIIQLEDITPAIASE